MTNIFNQLLLPVCTDLYLAVNTYLFPSVLPGILALVTFDITYLLFFFNREKKDTVLKRKNQIVLYLFFLYLAFVIYLTILSRPYGSRTGVDLMPFATVSVNLAGNIYAAENILLFIPFGILYCYLPLTVKRKAQCMLIGGAISVLIELTQYITQRGYLQTDDVILNVLGCYFGYIIGSRIIKLTDSLLLRSG